ncbi:2-oxoacid:acceptor oxidoreductase family protein [Oscillospiraceae bacterium OttesenSCG-928-G22]|nr:2-oxoacid:acceptor oxidoreductase family protein [Oscillospiraceae bacterium OttesenSCG-928-G22]
MSVTKQILLAGFGGQGILFMGKFLAYAGLGEGKEVSWLPSYGPEMRGGTANCSVILSDTPIGSPIVNAPDVLAVLNAPSFDKFEEATVPGGVVVVDSTLIPKKSKRDDVKNFYIPATGLAYDENLEGLANMIVLGKLIKEADLFPKERIQKAMEGVISAKKKNLLELNLKAIDMGYNYKS